jgi:hypothetical protein
MEDSGNKHIEINVILQKRIKYLNIFLKKEILF